MQCLNVLTKCYLLFKYLIYLYVSILLSSMVIWNLLWLINVYTSLEFCCVLKNIWTEYIKDPLNFIKLLYKLNILDKKIT